MAGASSRTGQEGTARAERARAVWSRDFALFFTARAIARLGDTMLPVALAAVLLQHGYGPARSASPWPRPPPPSPAWSYSAESSPTASAPAS
ncbi:hypothetical protein FM21_16500 [Streptomyces mutabilis]|uniref:MFS transporter n=1 Tax=Streptomyces mutabilis TaxID=67332 RepID=A0A086MUE2_9ACTN|nr:hypothetical protein FM21_16500 [Streptomyces mutabilis]